MRTIKNRLLAATIVAAALLGGCADMGNEPLGPAPQHDLLGTDTATTLASGIMMAVRITPAVEEIAVVVIDGNGGEVKAGGHMLVVTAGAVSEPTQFTVHVMAGNFVQVDLSAARVSDGAPVTTFATELRLRLNYRDVVLLLDESRLAVAYLADGTVVGRKQKMPSWVDSNAKYVDARLTHFSEYAIIFE